MLFFDAIILYIIIVLFSMGFSIVFKLYNKTFKNVDDKLLIDISVLLMMYLCIKYCNYDNTYLIVFINMPFIIAMLYKRLGTTILLSLVLVSFGYALGYNIYLLSSEYLFYILLFLIMQKKEISLRNILLVFVCFKGINLTVENIYVLNNNVYIVFMIYISLIIFYLIGITVMKIVNSIERMVDLNDALRELEKEKNLRTSLFKITHEIKNPIAVCKGYFAMMNYDELDKVKKYNSIIKEELDRTLDIMDNFSEYTKINVNKDIMDLDYLIKDTIKCVKSLLKKHNVKINYSYDKELLIEGDYNRLKQVLINIIKNSCEAINCNGFIDIDLKVNKKNLYLSLKDNGPGVDSETLKKIDNLFYTSKEKGCGIGVPISKEIIRLHDGEITFKSKLNKYMCTIIKLPIHNYLR